MMIKILLIFHLLIITFNYYSLKLNKIYFQTSSNDYNNNNKETNETVKKLIKNLEKYSDLPLNNSELNLINQFFIQTKNIYSEQYYITFKIGSNKKSFRLLLSTNDDFLTVSSTNCSSCNVSIKYNSIFTNSAIKLYKKFNQPDYNKNFNYDFFNDLIYIPLESIENGKIQQKNINISKLYFKVIELDSSGFLNSNLVDGILSLNYNKKSEIPNKNFIRELINEKIISSPSFSIIITSSNINRLYLGDIMNNNYIKNYLNSSMNKGECKIIDYNWQCRLTKIEYNDLNSYNRHLKYSNSILIFNLKDNKLTIPNKYYDLIVRSYYYKEGHKEYKKYCKMYGEIMYCTCYNKNNFGIVTFHFDKDSKLDINLQDYIYIDNTAYFYKCKVDINLSKYNEFIIGLKGLKNTILSFNMQEGKIKFFQKKKFIYNYLNILLIFILFLIVCIIFLVWKKIL